MLRWFFSLPWSTTEKTIVVREMEAFLTKLVWRIHVKKISRRRHAKIVGSHN